MTIDLNFPIMVIAFGFCVWLIRRKRPDPIVQRVEVSVPVVPQQLIMLAKHITGVEWDASIQSAVFEIAEYRFRIDNNDELYYYSEVKGLGKSNGKWRKARMEDFINFIHPMAQDVVAQQMALGAGQVNRRLQQQAKQNQRPQLQAPKVKQGKGNVCSNADAAMYWRNGDQFDRKAFAFEPNSPWYWEDDFNTGKFFVAKRGK